MAMKMTITKHSDWGKLYYYATELAFENGLDIPANMDEWSTIKLLNYIAKNEREYGQLSAIG